MLYTPEERNQIQHAYEMALRNSRAWEVLLPSEKLNILQSIEDKIAMDHNRITADVNFRQLPDHVWGQQLGNSIILNTSKMGSFEDMIATLHHESAHIEDAQLRSFPEKQLTLTEAQKAELAARNTPVPDADRDYKGYYHHPAEVNAREAEETGLARIQTDLQAIQEYDASHHATNQILQVYDELVLAPPTADPGLQEGPHSTGTETHSTSPQPGNTGSQQESTGPQQDHDQHDLTL